MLLIFRHIFLLISFTLLLSKNIEANCTDLKEESSETNSAVKTMLLEEAEDMSSVECFYELIKKSGSPSKYISNDIWLQLHPFIMPDDHPIKQKLDKIFSASRALCDLQSMIAAGFEPALPQHHTQIIVTKHPELKGYIVKAYLDIQEYHSGKPEYYFWKKRITGAQLIKKSIKNHKFEHLLKVPKKWIYLLPDEPSPPPNYLRKMFILVEEDMNIYDDRTNEALWGSSLVTNELLDALYTIITELGLRDCAKPANCPISRDCRVAFVDTQSYHAKTVNYYKLTPYLSPPMQQYWIELVKGKKLK